MILPLSSRPAALVLAVVVVLAASSPASAHSAPPVAPPGGVAIERSVQENADPYTLRAVFLYAVADTIEHDTPPPRVALEDPWLGQDKALHAGAGFLIALSSQYVFTSKARLSERGALPLSFGSAVLAGLAKEIHDSQRPVRPFFSWRDLVATAAGGAAAAVVVLL